MNSKKLFEAARVGNIEVLDSLLKENPSILVDIRLTTPKESLLHVATKSGQLNFVQKLMELDPEIAQEFNEDGFRPLDIAVILGNLEIVKELLRANQGLCRLKGKDEKTAIHYAAIKGRVDIINELMSICSECIQDVTCYGENVLHLSVKSYQFNSFMLLVNWLEMFSMQSLVNAGDCDGNTVLHLAVLTKQYKIIETLLKTNNFAGILELNSTNAKSLTALDALDIVLADSHDARVKEILQDAGAVRAAKATGLASQNPHVVTDTHSNTHGTPPDKETIWWEFFNFDINRDSPSETRNALLVVAALIATFSFQAGVNPLNIYTESPETVRAVVLFFFPNTLAFTASISLIMGLNWKLPFGKELCLSLYCMMFAYGFAVGLILGGMETKKKMKAYFILLIAFFSPSVLKWLRSWASKPWRKRQTSLPVQS